jgi:HEAT repeat protein
MECRELNASAVEQLLKEPDEAARRDLARHLEDCPACRAEMARIERTWQVLGEDPDAPVTPEFRDRTLALLEDEMLRRRIRAFRPRPRWTRPLAYAAGLALAALAGVLLARNVPWPAAPSSAASRLSSLLTPAASSASSAPAIEGGRLTNVAYTPPDAQGRIGVSFDMESRRTVVGRPDDPAMAKLLAYLVSRSAQTAGEKSQAIEQVSSHYGSRVAPASPDIVRALTATLRKDPNPGVRKKAADALAGFTVTPEIRAAFLEALNGDKNPAVRLVAIDTLSAAARQTPDPRTIESLRQKAFDPAENGFVRTKAASALKAMEF